MMDPRSILLLPTLAFPSQRNPNSWYISTHVRICIIFRVLDQGARASNTPDNTSFPLERQLSHQQVVPWWISSPGPPCLIAEVAAMVRSTWTLNMELVPLKASMWRMRLTRIVLVLC